MRAKKYFGLLALGVVMAFIPILASAATFNIAAPYDTVYTAIDLGAVPDLPTPYGGMTLKAGDNNTLLIGGGANGSSGAFYDIGLTRDANNHITGFAGTATLFSEGAYNDGGLQYGPGGVLFYTRYNTNQIGEIKPGSSATDKVVDLSPLGVSSSVGALALVPTGFPGAGQFKLVSYNSGDWYTATLSPDGSGTYDIISPTLNTTIEGSPEAMAYVPLGSALFPAPSLLQCEYGAGKVATYELDANGNPIPASRQDFITDLGGAEGAFIDPLTGDFLFSTFGGGNHVVVVEGFVAPPVPIPPTLLLFASGLVGLVGLGRKLKRI
jgi:hypothetical protein